MTLSAPKRLALAILGIPEMAQTFARSGFLARTRLVEPACWGRGRIRAHDTVADTSDFESLLRPETRIADYGSNSDSPAAVHTNSVRATDWWHRSKARLCDAKLLRGGDRIRPSANALRRAGLRNISSTDRDGTWAKPRASSGLWITSRSSWYLGPDLNRRPRHYECRALTS
jgi:hypothetical protein